MTVVNKIINVHDNYVELQFCGKCDETFLVSTENVNNILQNKWYKSKSGYPMAYIGSKVKLHRYLFNDYANLENYVIDHINRNKLDNRLSNLRICTKAENSYNRTISKNSKNKYKGVRYNKKSNTWSAFATKDKKEYKLEGFITENDAADGYNILAEELFGHFAAKNIII